MWGERGIVSHCLQDARFSAAIQASLLLKERSGRGPDEKCSRAPTCLELASGISAQVPDRQTQPLTREACLSLQACLTLVASQGPPAKVC